jgi:hypothetical protein
MIKAKLAALVISVLALVAATDPATTLKDSQCMANALSDKDLAFAIKALDIKDPNNVSDEPNIELGKILVVAEDQCDPAGDWDAERSDAAITLTTAVFIRAGASNTLDQAGVDPAVLAAWFEEQDEAFRLHLFNGMTEAQSATRMAASFKDLNKRGISTEKLAENINAFSVFLATSSMITRLNKGLPAQESAVK